MHLLGLVSCLVDNAGLRASATVPECGWVPILLAKTTFHMEERINLGLRLVSRGLEIGVKEGGDKLMELPLGLRATLGQTPYMGQDDLGDRQYLVKRMKIHKKELGREKILFFV